MELTGSATWPVKPQGCAVEPSGSERDTMEPRGRERDRWANREVETGAGNEQVSTLSKLRFDLTFSQARALLEIGTPRSSLWNPAGVDFAPLL